MCIRDRVKGYYGKVVYGRKPITDAITFWVESVAAGWSDPDSGLDWIKCDRREAEYIAIPQKNWRVEWYALNDKLNIMREASKIAANDTQEDAEKTLVDAGAWYFKLGEPLDGVDDSELKAELFQIVEEVVCSA